MSLFINFYRFVFCHFELSEGVCLAHRFKVEVNSFKIIDANKTLENFSSF